MNAVTKAAVSVSEMARMCSMSRARFYQLINDGVFPKPEYEVSTSRPFYGEEAQTKCLEVRRRNLGINGRPVLFYPTRTTTSVRRPPKSKPRLTTQHVEVIDSLACLGLSVTSQQVESAIRECYPSGLVDDQGVVVRTLFLHLKRQNPADNVRR